MLFKNKKEIDGKIDYCLFRQKSNGKIAYCTKINIFIVNLLTFCDTRFIIKYTKYIKSLR